MERVIRSHLGWLVVWGNVFGAFFNFYTEGHQTQNSTSYRIGMGGLYRGANWSRIISSWLRVAGVKKASRSEAALTRTSSNDFTPPMLLREFSFLSR